MINISVDGETLLSAVTLLSRRELQARSIENRAAVWDNVTRSTADRLVSAVASFYAKHAHVTIHTEAPRCDLEWSDDTDVIAFTMAATAYVHEDMSHRLMSKPEGEGKWIRLRTKCGCESRSMLYDSPPPVLQKLVDGGQRSFHRGEPNAFGTIIYSEA